MEETKKPNQKPLLTFGNTYSDFFVIISATANLAARAEESCSRNSPFLYIEIIAYF
ncbi:hypothetical protein ME0901_14340 [Lactobacillus delbrueckii subsp. bulgaricus]|uniref:Uncharacterized protein n=1 Tax=Lactobacillus delbrueckii subsp. bulgaricus TaxID=1585 RepID=A0AAV5PDZ2_LACDE|nr:hypothetical protein ME0899_14940 [Lactobacillus delbrueckii subsp. bulgaricus]GMB86859.1 hypothetical protein ME0900_12320 [Lactobacillus delbrueckii subsp. bulgaricus]GMB88912.1 hypothetical protein ME0901_14340 [Lactobacillus delbrueckii subsp. bulgaricus]